jgi:hypothetical protein
MIRSKSSLLYRNTDFLTNVFFNFYCFIIHMCIQCLGHFSQTYLKWLNDMLLKHNSPWLHMGMSCDGGASSFEMYL